MYDYTLVSSAAAAIIISLKYIVIIIWYVFEWVLLRQHLLELPPTEEGVVEQIIQISTLSNCTSTQTAGEKEKERECV